MKITEQKSFDKEVTNRLPNLAKSKDKKPEINSESNKGSQFTISLPLDESFYSEKQEKVLYSETVRIDQAEYNESIKINNKK